ncbi:MAG TPA: glycosyltransferase family 4 protein [Ktedonobacterales bacterium]
MRIAQVAPLHLTVPPQSYGGTERCIYNLTEALVEAGHDVTLFAARGSETSARLIPMRDDPIRFNSKLDATALHLAMLQQVYRRASEFDVIHSHLDYLTLPFAAASDTPTVITLHGRLDGPETVQILQTFKDCNYVAISESQRSQISDLNWTDTIYHAIDLRPIPFHDQPGSYLVFVGRISPEKGPDRAIRIAQRAGIPLKIAAKIDPANRRYFDQVIKPLLEDPSIEFLGPVNEKRKQSLMGHALALLEPIHWPEPFGMVFIESLACGTPVLTCPHGSVPELLRDGVTGFACESEDDLVAAVHQVSHISRAGCREYVRQKFDINAMALEYVEVYSKVQQRRRLFAVPAERPADSLAEQLAETEQHQDNLDPSSLIS